MSSSGAHMGEATEPETAPSHEKKGGEAAHNKANAAVAATKTGLTLTANKETNEEENGADAGEDQPNGDAPSVDAGGINFDTMTKEQVMAMLQKQQAMLQKQQAMLQKQHEILEARKKTLEASNYRGSVREMIDKFGGIPDMPKVKGLEPHQDNNRSTDFSVDAGFVTANDLRFSINLKDHHDKTDLKSFLLFERLDHKDGKEILSYHNKATVAHYVQGVVKTCLHTLGIFQSCILFKEMSFFSLRPDLILVQHEKKGVILIIDVKMPGEELFQSKKIAAQVADYLVLQYRLGNSTPLVLLSSYREACLCHLKPGSLERTEEEEEASDGCEGDNPSDVSAYRKLVEKGTKLIRANEGLAGMMGGDGEDHKGSEKPNDHSPKKTAFQSDENIPHSLSQNPSERGKRKRSPPKVHIVKPEVVYSEPFTLNNMMQGVSLAIVCGLVSLEHKAAATPEKVWPDQGCRLDGLHPCVEEDTLKWARVTDMTIDYMKRPLACGGHNKYILVQEIGRGYNGRVFLGVDVNGDAFALKFYLDKVDAETDFSAKERDKKRNDNFEKTKSKAKEELRRWKVLQPGYEDYVEYLQLNQQNVLRMPVFAPVPPEKRKEVLPAVGKKLHMFFNAHSLVYNELRWQHIGCRRLTSGTAEENAGSDLEIVLLDLESLTAVTNETVDLVAKQIEMLEDRMDSDAASAPTGELF